MSRAIVNPAVAGLYQVVVGGLVCGGTNRIGFNRSPSLIQWPRRLRSTEFVLYDVGTTTMFVLWVQRNTLDDLDLAENILHYHTAVQLFYNTILYVEISTQHAVVPQLDLRDIWHWAFVQHLACLDYGPRSGQSRRVAFKSGAHVRMEILPPFILRKFTCNHPDPAPPSGAPLVVPSGISNLTHTSVIAFLKMWPGGGWYSNSCYKLARYDLNVEAPTGLGF
jgi:hypothetical protein